MRETETVHRRFQEAFTLGGVERDPKWWWAIIVPVLLLALFYVVAMYRKDARAVGWRWASFLGTLRVGVYAVLAYMFTMPAKQTWEKIEKGSRVLVVIDVSESMSKVSDEIPNPAVATPDTRLKKVLDYLSDDNVAFMKKLLDKNPAFVYRVGARLDDESQHFVKLPGTDGADAEYKPVERIRAKKDGSAETVTGDAWKAADWADFAAYNFKPWVTARPVPRRQVARGRQPGVRHRGVRQRRLGEEVARREGRFRRPGRADGRGQAGPRRQPREAQAPARNRHHHRPGDEPPRVAARAAQPRVGQHGAGPGRVQRRPEQPRLDQRRVRPAT